MLITAGVPAGHGPPVPKHHHLDVPVAAEGLVSMLGVPLVAGDRVLGVVRCEPQQARIHPRRDRLVERICRSRAAVVLQTRRLLEQTRVAAQEAEWANAVLANNVTAMERASGVYEDLTAVVLRGGVAETLGKELE